MKMPPTSLIVGLPFLLSNTASALSVHVAGVNPSIADKYVPVSPGKSASENRENWTWKCLDGSKEISWVAVNDDYCDCPDGSDEPGTSACSNGVFYCQNAGHIGATISSSRVGDGLCEPECCDGSDESHGVCPNLCDSIGKEYREQREATRKLRKTGSKIRGSYVAFAQKEKKRLEDSLKELKKEVQLKKKEVERTKDLLSTLESMDATSLEYKKQSPLFSHLTSSKNLISSLHTKSKNLQKEIDSLKRLLDDLETGYNPNYVDMAVINTVKAWKGMKGATKEPETDSAVVAEASPPPVITDEEDEEDEEENYDSQVNGLEGVDLVTLLLDHEKHVSGASATQQDDVKALLFSIEDYLPDAILPAYEMFKENIVTTLAMMGVIPKPNSSVSEETSKARTAHNNAESALSEVESKLTNDRNALDKLFSVQWYGKEGEWKKLDGTCLSKDTGEYTYSVCLFGSATQKSNKGGMTQNLGTFASWAKDSSVVPGSAAYYSQQYYSKGTKCWNGPERSVTLDLSCGTENALLSVSEPEKCEYRIVGTTPALCVPEEEEETRGREEL